ncbi:MAG: hypothetical protein IBX43_09215 [Campylobacterales bacterium]|nr:hypothetical protein [Campylobacterales bacterium]
MKPITKLLAIALLAVTAYSAPQKGDAPFTPSDNKKLAVVYTFDKNIDEEFFSFVKKDLKELGYFLSDQHQNVQAVYANNFGSTKLNNLAFTPMMHEETIRPLLNKDPRLAGFSPFNLLTFRKESDMKTVISHLTPEAMLDILEIDDKELRASFTKSFEPLSKAITEKFGAEKSYADLKGRAEDTMMNFEIPFEEPEDIDDFLEEFEQQFRTAFEEKGYIIAGFYNVKWSFNSDEDVMPEYNSFWTFSLCHIPFSYNVFDGDSPLPLAGIFAPCSMYVYVRKGENKVVIGMPTLGAWAGALNITDPKKLEKINQLDVEIPAIIKSIGGISVPNGNPLTRK